MTALRSLRIFVYRNLHTGCFSLRDVNSGLVIAHAAEVLLHDAIFKVSEAGRQRVFRTRHRNVHAGVEGDVVFEPRKAERIIDSLTEEVHYNPFVNEFFTTGHGNYRIDASPFAYFLDGKVFI